MCHGLGDEHWHGVGATPWSGELIVLEQCQECGTYRARTIDPDGISVIDGDPDRPPQQAPRTDGDSSVPTDTSQGSSMLESTDLTDNSSDSNPGSRDDDSAESDEATDIITT